MLAIHPQARTTSAARAEIARSPESSDVLAKRYSVSTETIRKWRKRGPDACQDRSARGGSLELTIRSVIGTHVHKRELLSGHLEGYYSRATRFPLDALTFVVSHLPHRT